MRLPSIIRKLLERWGPGIDIALAVSVIVSTGWLTDFLRGEPFAPFEDLPPVDGWLASVGVALTMTAITATLLYKRRLNFIPVRHLGSQQDVTPHKVLIACLSHNTAEVSKDGDLLRVKLGNNNVLLSSDLTKEKDSPELRGWNWQQLLRAIAPHTTDGTLEHIYIFCSHESLRQSKDCELVLHHFLGDAVQVHIQQRPIDFENLEDLYSNFNNVIQEVTQRLGYAQSDVMIDVTGGQKTTSIAAALVTLHRPPIEFQYVSTRGCCPVLSYNVVATSPVGLES